MDYFEKYSIFLDLGFNRNVVLVFGCSDPRRKHQAYRKRRKGNKQTKRTSERKKMKMVNDKKEKKKNK